MTFEERKLLVERCTQAGTGVLYRKLYALQEADVSKKIESEDEWRALPFVTKNIQTETPFSERLFASRFDIDHLRASSGTSGKPPVFSPRTYLRGMEYRKEYHDFKKPILAYGVPAMPYWHEEFQNSVDGTPLAIVLDPKNMSASALLARIAGTDGISTFAYHIMPLGEALKKEGITENIKFIEICGESCTRALYEYIRSTFPNATLIPFYGSSEVEDSPIGKPCRAINGEDPLSVYHAKKSQYHEIIDPETLKPIEPVAGAQGELVISAYPGEPSAFPLIRYRTGDMIRVVESNCPKHNAWSFTVLGRSELDFIKIPGGVLRADEAERVLRKHADEITDRFELHYYERITEDGPKVQIELQVETKVAVDLALFASAIALELRVNPSTTYADGVIEGRYLQLICKELPKTDVVGKKKRLVKH